MKKILVVAAHPDDEVIFLWPATFLSAEAKVTVVCCSDDRDNSARPVSERRAEAFKEVADALKFTPILTGGNSEFSRLPHRPENLLSQWWSRARSFIANAADEADVVYTHNPHGEYGHTDHRLLHQLVLGAVNKPVMFTDIRQQINWPVEVDASGAYARTYFRSAFRSVMTASGDEMLQNAEAIYRRHNAWTWSEPVVRECYVYTI